MRRTTSGNTEGLSSGAYVVGRSGIHGRGLFAARGLKMGERIVEYVGERKMDGGGEENGKRKMENGRDRRVGVYVFEVGEGVYLDGEIPGNAARWINHSCAPNCEAVEEAGRVWIFARQDVAEGEELTFDYGFRLESFLGHPCRCGAAGCAGFIVNAWERRRVGRLLGRKGRSLARGGRPLGLTRRAGA